MGEMTDSGDAALGAASEIREELELHVAQCAAELERSGMPRVEAIAEAHRRFGNFDSHVEACRREAPEEQMRRKVLIVTAATVALLLGVTAWIVTSLVPEVARPAAMSLDAHLVPAPDPDSDPSELVVAQIRITDSSDAVLSAPRIFAKVGEAASIQIGSDASMTEVRVTSRRDGAAVVVDAELTRTDGPERLSARANAKDGPGPVAR
jgi:hypothetical protein